MPSGPGSHLPLAAATPSARPCLVGPPQPPEASRDPRLVTFRCRPCWWGRNGLGARASMQECSRARLRSILLAALLSCRLASTYACVHSCMHERMAGGRKACRVGLPRPVVEGLAEDGVDVRLGLDLQAFMGAVLGGQRGRANLIPRWAVRTWSTACSITIVPEVCVSTEFHTTTTRFIPTF